MLNSIIEMDLNTVFVYQYKPTDKAEYGTFIACKVGMYPDVTDIYSLDGGYIESTWQIDDESQFVVLYEFSADLSQKLMKLYNSFYSKLGFSADFNDAEEDMTSIYSNSEIRNALIDDYPELFI